MSSIRKNLILVIVAVTISIVVAKFTVNRDVRFELHTREHSLESYEELRADEHGGYGRTEEPDPDGFTTIFNASRPTRMFIHGYWSSRRAFLRYAKAFLHSDDCNFIAVNWLNGSKTYNYWRARGRVERVSIGRGEIASY